MAMAQQVARMQGKQLRLFQLEKQEMMRTIQNALQRDGRAREKCSSEISEILRSSYFGAGLRGLASAGRLIEDGSEDSEGQQKQQADSNVDTILDFAIGAAMALTEHTAPEEQQAM